MYTALELYDLRQNDGSAQLPGIDFQVGNLTPASSLMGLQNLPIVNTAGYYYDAALNLVRVTKAGAVLDGINFGTASIQISASNVTIENCTFKNTTSYSTIHVLTGAANATVKGCTFDDGMVPTLDGAYISSGMSMTITGNKFLNTPGDGLDVSGGVISGNYIQGGGVSSNGVHPDAVWVTNNVGQTMVVANNFIDWTETPGSTARGECIRITTELGSVGNVTVTGNYMVGGSATVDAGNTVNAGAAYSNINISNNYIGFGDFYAVMPGPNSGVTYSGNTVYDFTNPVYSAAAFAAYKTAGNLNMTDAVVAASAATTTVGALKTGSTTLLGAGVAGAFLGGGSGAEVIFIGGAGSQTLWGSAGRNIFTYLSIGDSQTNHSDAIGNFHAATDVVDLHAINGNPQAGGFTSLAYIGSAAFDGKAGEVRVVQDSVNNQTLVEVALASDTNPDMIVRIGGLQTLTAGNFALTAAQFLAATVGATTIAEFKANEYALDKIGGLGIVDTAANVESDLYNLNADVKNIASITTTDAPVTTSSGAYMNDYAVLSKANQAVNIVDGEWNVYGSIDRLENYTSHIGTVVLSGDTAANPFVMTMTTAEIAADAKILAEIVSPFETRTTDTGAVVLVGHGNGLQVNIAAGTTVATGGGTSELFNVTNHFGSLLVTDFAANALNANHDTIAMSTLDFSTWSTFCTAAKASGTGDANTTFTANDGAQLTLNGMSLGSFVANQNTLKSDFVFH